MISHLAFLHALSIQPSWTSNTYPSSHTCFCIINYAIQPSRYLFHSVASKLSSQSNPKLPTRHHTFTVGSSFHQSIQSTAARENDNFTSTSQGSVYFDSKIGTVDFSDPWLQNHSRILAYSYERVTGSKMQDLQGIQDYSQDPELLCRTLFLSQTCAILSHNVIALGGGDMGDVAFGYGKGNVVRIDNMYNYGNQLALETFERKFADMGTVPSTLSALPDIEVQKERNKILGDCFVKGYVDLNIERVTATGKKVRITGGILYNLHDELGIYRGQAVYIPKKFISRKD